MTALAVLATPSFTRAASCGATSPGGAAISDFASDVIVQADSTVTVRETLQLTVSGRPLAGGIYRDLPSHYQSAAGHVFDVGISLLDARRDGTAIAHSSVVTADGTRWFLGAPNATLPPGEYTYTLGYQVVGALGFFADRDELYWPDTGSTWIIPIDCATTTVQLPFNVPPGGIQAAGWIGPEAAPTQPEAASVDRSG
ncbi:MAG TPA: DUF2207 domain-containing protein, partial [Chloroflexota bacterium]|nr:DUF2207 domain-containing protein [Chloroflexota bacterium]